jgi:chromate reductase
MKVLGISGSLRKASLNSAALRACGELMPEGMTLTVYSGLGDIPLYNQEIMDAGVPASVAKLRDAVVGADCLLIASPEYNFSMSAALKNAIDWLSRLQPQPLMEKPAAIFSVSGGPLGGARVQYDLRRVLGQLWVHVLPRPEVFIGSAPGKFDAQGKLTDETTRKFLTDLAAGLKTWTVRMKAGKPA